jgi:hypothetical protein
MYVCPVCVVHFAGYYMHQRAGKAQSVSRLDHMFEESWFDSRQGHSILLKEILTGSETHPTSYSVGVGRSRPGSNRKRREANHLPPYSA